MNKQNIIIVGSMSMSNIQMGNNNSMINVNKLPIEHLSFKFCKNEESMLEIDSRIGDIVCREDDKKQYMLTKLPSHVLSSWSELSTPNSEMETIVCSYCKGYKTKGESCPGCGANN